MNIDKYLSYQSTFLGKIWFITKNHNFHLYIDRDGMPVLIAEDGAFNKILIFGLENCYDLMIKK